MKTPRNNPEVPPPSTNPDVSPNASNEIGDSPPGVPSSLEGWRPELHDPGAIRPALERAFDYRGDVTLVLKGGRVVEGYVFDRKLDAPDLDDCHVRLLPREGGEKVSVRCSEIDRLEFTGRDTAAGDGFEQWLKRYNEKKEGAKKPAPAEAEQS